VRLPRRLAFFSAIFVAAVATAAEPITFVGYNVNNWLTMDRYVDGKRVSGQPKPEEEKAAVVGILNRLKPDILGVVEMGSKEDLADLQSRLKAKGIDLPHPAWVEGPDVERHVALLSRFPIVSDQSVSNLPIDLNGAPLAVQRGILDVTIEPAEGYQLRVVGVHFKSKRDVPDFDQAQLRAREAAVLREHVTGILKEDPEANVLIFGDFNDTKNEYPVRHIISRSAKPKLTDLQLTDDAGERWTHYWRTADIYSRLDYLVVSPGLLPEIDQERSGIDSSPDWNRASDHRAVHTTITPSDQ